MTRLRTSFDAFRREGGAKGWQRKAAAASPSHPLADVLRAALGLGLYNVISPDPDRPRMPGAAALLSLALWLAAVIIAIAHGIATYGSLDKKAAANLGKVVEALGPIGGIGAAYALATGAIAVLSAALLHIARQSAYGYSSFHTLYGLVATLGAALSSATSFLGIQMVFSGEAPSLWNDWLVPFGLSLFIFVYALALWLGGGDLIRRSFWPAGSGAIGIAGAFAERLLKWLLLLVPAMGLFVLSSWTSAIGLGGREAMRVHYAAEIIRIEMECASVVAFRTEEEEFVVNLRLTAQQLKTLAAEEARTGVVSGLSGAGAVVDYLRRMSLWLDEVTNAAEAELAKARAVSGRGAKDLGGRCEQKGDELRRELAKLPGAKLKEWERKFADKFGDLSLLIAEARAKGSAVALVSAQLASIDAKVVRPRLAETALGRAQAESIGRYAETVKAALGDLLQRYGKGPPQPRPATPVMGLAEVLGFAGRVAPETEDVPGLAVITARQAVLQYARETVDIWAFVLAWDFASYLLLSLYVVFPALGRASPKRAEDGGLT